MTVASPPRAYSYIRFSSPEQSKGTSLERQLEASVKYAKEHGLELDDKLVLRDLGRSAYDGSNLAPDSALGQFLALVRNGDIPRGSYLLVESLDRLSRAHIDDAIQLFLELRKHNIVIVTLMDGWQYKTTNTPADFQNLLMSLVIFSRANEESATKADRLSKAWIKKRKRADEERMTKICPAWLSLSADRKSYELIPEKAAIVREIIQMTLDGLGRHSIARNLNDRGIETIGRLRSRTETSKQGKTNPDRIWYESYIKKILENRSLVGEFQPHREERVPGKPGAKKRIPEGDPISNYFPALVSEEEFALLQSEIKSRGAHLGGRRGATFSNLFTKLVRCGYCDRPMTCENKGLDFRGNRDNRRNKYLVCSTAKRGLGCHRLPWIYHEFEDSFFEHATKVNFAEFVSRSNDRKNEVRSLRDQCSILQEQLNQNRDSQERLLDAIEKDADLGARINDRLKQRIAEAEDLATKLAAAKGDLARQEQHQVSGATAVAALTQIRKELGEQTDETAFAYRARVNHTLRHVIDQIVIYPGGLLSTAAERNEARKRLLAWGHLEQEVETVLDLTFRTKPSPADRCYSIINRDDSLQVLYPDSPMPDPEKRLQQARERGVPLRTVPAV